MHTILRILRSGHHLRGYYATISVFTVLLALMNLVQPLLAGWAIDEVRKGSGASITYVVMLAVLIFAADLLANLFSNISGYLGDQMSLKLNRHLSYSYFDHLLKLPQNYFDTELSGKVISRLNRSINQITNFIQIMSNNFLQFLFTTIFTLVLVAHYSWQVALMMLVVYPIYIYFTARSSRKWRSYQTKKNRRFDMASGRFAEVVNQVKVVRSFLQEKRELSFFGHQYQRAENLNRSQSRYWHVQDVYRRLSLNIIFFAIYLFIFIEGARGLLTPGHVATLILYGMQIRIPIFTISMLIDTTQRAITDSRDYFEVMDLAPAITDIPDAAQLAVSKGKIVFDSVCFGYGEDQPVLKDITFTVLPHLKVALVGESGEGKTTLTNLLLRLYEPQSGTILIDGQDISKVTQASLRANIAVVFQEAALFSGTIRENIAYGKPSATDEEIIAAAKAANAHEFIEKFAQGYGTQIGERGLKLSGGQKQRIAIARAILKDAPILILDEATSSLDSRSEHLVQTALEHLMKGRTTIIIAHRLSTIQHVNQIITLRNGHVDETGSPEELAHTDGIYARLLKLQQQHTSTTAEKLREFEIKEA